MVTDASNQLRADHGLAQAAAETRDAPKGHSVMWRDGHRKGFTAGVEWARSHPKETQ